MALIRLTPEIAEILSKSMGISPQQIREAINKGTLIGGKPLGADSRIYQIDDQYLPKELSQQPKVETSEGAKTELQSIADKIEIAKKQIELDEINKVRDLPKELEARGKQLDQQSKDNIDKEISLNTREQVLKSKELEIAEALKSLSQKQYEAQKYCDDKIREGNQIVESALKGSEEINAEVEKQRVDLDELQNKINDYPNLVQPLKDELQKLIGIAQKNSKYHYQRADATISKPQISDWHTNRSNRFWGLEKEFKKLLRWLG